MTALECWSGRPSTDEDVVEQVLMKTQDRSEAFPLANSAPTSPSFSKDFAGGTAPPMKKWRSFGRSFAGAITALRNSLNLETLREQMLTSKPPTSDKLIWAGVVRNLTQLYPGSQLPEKLISNIRRHFDSLPNNYAQADHGMKDVLLHVRLIEQATADDYPAIHIQEATEFAGTESVMFRLTFASVSPISWQSMYGTLDSSFISCKKIQIFEKKGLTLGIVTLLVYSGGEKLFRAKVEAAVKSAVKKPRNSGVNLHFGGLCGCQDEGAGMLVDDGDIDDDNGSDISEIKRLPTPSPDTSTVVSVDEWQTIISGGEEINKWLLISDQLELLDHTGPTSFKGVYRGDKVWVKKLRGCDRGIAYQIEVKRNLMDLMSSGHKNILQLYGLCLEETHGMCLVTRRMKGGSVHDLIQKSKRVPIKDVLRISVDVAEGLMFLNDHGVPYRDLNTQRILLDKQGNACLGDVGVANGCKNAGDYETAGYRWLAPEVIAGDPETVTETWMSNVYSFGMVVWEMVTGEAAYCSYSPVQAAVGIVACGLRPEIPKDCPQVLRSVMTKCWNNNPSKRPSFSKIVPMLLRQQNGRINKEEDVAEEERTSYLEEE